MYGFKIIKDSDINEDNSKSYKQGRIINKYRSDAYEINIYEMKAGSGFTIDSTETIEALKTYCIISGKCRNVETGRILTSGDMLVTGILEDYVNIEILKDVKILVHSHKDALYDNVEKQSDYTVKLLHEIQSKDGYTYQHCMNVYHLARKMGMKLRYTGNRFFNLIYAAAYHDIGKVYIDDAILSKPSALTPHEYEIMKGHTVLSKDIILERYGEKIYDIIVQHHERINGSGYPYGLKGDQISEEGMILAICDSYDAMISDRVYKKALNKQEALTELRECSGKIYDKRLTDIFIEIIEHELHD